MYRRFAPVAFVLFLMLNVPARGQTFFRPLDYGISLGASQYFGDLNEHYGLQTVHPSGGGFIRLWLNQFIALKAVVNYTKVGYDDKYNKSDPYAFDRNLSFTSNIVEAAVQAEFNFFRFATGDPDHRFTPYLTLGAGAFYYNPYSYIDGVKYSLQYLGTEGQNAGYSGNKYSHVAMCFPVGAGVKFWIRPGMNLNIEFADRLTTTDYLDDVSSVYVGASNFPNGTFNPAYVLQNKTTNPNSTLGQAGKQRGNTASSDQYFMGIISLSFQFKTYKCPTYMSKGFIQTD